MINKKSQKKIKHPGPFVVDTDQLAKNILLTHLYFVLGRVEKQPTFRPHEVNPKPFEHPAKSALMFRLWKENATKMFFSEAKAAKLFSCSLAQPSRYSHILETS